MRVTAAFSRLLDLPGVWVKKVRFEPDRVVVTVALRRRRLHCPKCSYATRHRENRQKHESVWRHLDLGVWRLEVHAMLRRLRCPEHGVHVEGVPFARDGAQFTRDFENLAAWLASKTDKTATCRLVRIDWRTIGRIIERVAGELIDSDRLSNLFEISVDEVAWRKGHRYLTLIGDHLRGCVVWGCEGKGQAAADQFFAELDPEVAASPSPPPQPATHTKQPRQAPEPAIMVPFGPCPTVPAGEGIPGAWLAPGSELDPALVARASRLTAVSMDMTGGYAASVRQHAPQATIVIDNYHVVQVATKALDEVRHEHWNELRRAGETRCRQAVQARPLGAAEEPRRSDRLPDRHARRDPRRRREGRTRLGDEGDGQSDLRPRPHRRGRQRTARPPPRAPLSMPPCPVHPAGAHDPQAP
jgi:transposase